MTVFALVLPFGTQSVTSVDERRQANDWASQWADKSRRDSGPGPWSASLWLFGEQPWFWRVHDYYRDRREWWPCPVPPPSWLLRHMVRVDGVRGPSDVAEPERWHGQFT